MSDKSLPKLTPRLAAVCAYVRNGAAVADVGTDHAYLPVYLLGAGLTPSAVAADLRPGPLARARLSAARFGVTENLRFVLSDGLEAIKEAQADDIVIAGMGGELIARIIAQCAWLKNPAKHLVLQPMSAQEELRTFLCANGFRIEKETAAAEKDGQKEYVVLSVFYDGVIRACSPIYSYTGELKADEPDARAYLERKARALIKKAEGLGRAEESSAQAQEAAQAKGLAAGIMALCAQKGRRVCTDFKEKLTAEGS